MALLVFGLIVVGLRQGVGFGIAAWNTQARMLGRTAALDPVDRTLRTMIGQAAAAEGVRRPALIGGATRLAFVTHLPQGAFADPRSGGEAEIVLGLDAAHRLMLTYTPHAHVRWLTQPAAVGRSLIDGLESVRFSYYRAAGPITGPGGWQSEWRAVDLPELVRIHLTFPRGDPRHWPDIVAATRLDPPEE